MDTLKEVGAIIGSIAGIITALVPVFAYFFGKKKAESTDPPTPVRILPDAVGPESVIFPCGQCGKKLQAQADLAGKKVQCPHCGQAVQVPWSRPMVHQPFEPIPVLVLAEPTRKRPHRDHGSYEETRKMVRVPALMMLWVGCLGVCGNLFMAGFGYIDEFVTPLSSSSMKEWEEQKGATKTIVKEGKNTHAGETSRERSREKSSAIAAIVMLAPNGFSGVFVNNPPLRFSQRTCRFGSFPGSAPVKASRPIVYRNRAVYRLVLVTFSLASGVSVWAAYNMLHLRNYWLAMFGSVAVMPGACMCCFLGIPTGIWSIVVLLQKDVQSTFQ